MYKSKRLGSIEVSPIVQISEAARTRRASGADIISLGTGEPDFPTPKAVCDAAYEAMLRGETSYPTNQGINPLREVIAARYSEQGLAVDNSQVIASTGAKQVLFNAFMATLNPGDEVIIPAPYWSTYVDMVKMVGGKPIIVDCPQSQGFVMQAEQLEAAITPHSRWVLLNSPGNPTGAIYTHEQLMALQAVLEAHPAVMLVSDEIYEHIVYTPDYVSVGLSLSALQERLLIVNGVSKAYAMTGWRLGYGIGPQWLIAAMSAVQSQITSGASSISQAAALAALQGDQSLLAARCQQFRQRRDTIVNLLNAIDGVDCLNPDGAFYVFPDCQQWLDSDLAKQKGIHNDVELCAYLLESAEVALVPGSAFGMPGHFRASYAYAEELIQQAGQRLQQAFRG